MKKLIIFLMMVTINVCGMQLSKKQIESNDKLIKEFRKNGSKINYKSVKELLKCGANPNIRDTEESGLELAKKYNRGGLAPLHKAAMWLRGDLVDLLLLHNADPNVRIDNAGNDNTPLLVLLCQEEESGVDNIRSIMKALLKAGADPDIKNSVGRSANTFAKALIDGITVEIVNDSVKLGISLINSIKRETGK